MGIFSAPSSRVGTATSEVAGGRSRVRPRIWLAALGAVLWVVALSPPLSSWSLRYGFVQAIQFCFFAVVVPPLVVLGRPWFALRLVSSDGVPGLTNEPASRGRLFDGLVRRRVVRRGNRRAIVETFLFIVIALAWRLSPAVDALVHHSWLDVVESLTLVVAGVAMWLDLIESAPFAPCTTRPFRIGATAIAMWIIWIDAYVMAMTQSSWYRVFEDVSHRAMSVSADQQITAGTLWFFGAIAFIPVVFWNLNQWLRSEEDPNEELYRLVRQERSRGFFGSDS